MIAPILPAFFYLLFLALGAFLLSRPPPRSVGGRSLHVLDGVLGVFGGLLSLLWCFAAAAMPHYGSDVPVSEDLERMVIEYPVGVLLGLAACFGGVAIATRGLRTFSSDGVKPKREAPEV